MHHVGGQWIILEGTIIRLDYAASREAASSTYMHTGRSRGRAGTQFYIGNTQIWQVVQKADRARQAF